MHGSEVGTLEVKKETLSSAQTTSLLKKTSSQGNAWQTASVFVSGNENTRVSTIFGINFREPLILRFSQFIKNLKI